MNRLSPVFRSNLIRLEDEKLHPRFGESNTINILSTTSAAVLDTLIEKTKAVFGAQIHLSNFSNKLLLLVQDGVSIQKLLDYAYQTFGNPLLLLDPSLCLISHAGTDSLSDEPVIGHVLSKGYMPEQYIEEVMKEETNLPEENRVLIIWEKDFLKHRLIAGRIVRKNHLIGYLKLLEYNRLFTDWLDVERFQLFCQYLAICLNSHFLTNHSGEPYVEALLLGMIDRKLMDVQEIDERVDICGLETYKYKTVIIVELEKKYRNTDKLYLLKQKLQSFLNRNTLFINDEDIIILYNKASREKLFNSKKLAAFQTLLEANNARSGFSMAFKEIHDFYKHYTQSLACFQVAAKIRLNQRVYLYEDHVIEHMFLHFGEIFDLKGLIHPCVQRLLLIDAKKDSELTETLFSFLKYKQDITAAAKAIHIHYNTLKYRILRIEELTDLDFNDENTIFRVMLSERILQLKNQISDVENSPKS